MNAEYLKEDEEFYWPKHKSFGMRVKHIDFKETDENGCVPVIVSNAGATTMAWLKPDEEVIPGDYT